MFLASNWRSRGNFDVQVSNRVSKFIFVLSYVSKFTIGHLAWGIIWPLDGAMNRFKELDLHEKLYHSRYLSKECPKCMMRFLEDKQLKHHLQYTCSRFCPKIESSSTSGSSSLSRKTRRSLTEYQNQNSWFFLFV